MLAVSTYIQVSHHLGSRNIKSIPTQFSQTRYQSFKKMLLNLIKSRCTQTFKVTLFWFWKKYVKLIILGSKNQCHSMHKMESNGEYSSALLQQLFLKETLFHLFHLYLTVRRSTARSFRNKPMYVKNKEYTHLHFQDTYHSTINYGTFEVEACLESIRKNPKLLNFTKFSSFIEKLFQKMLFKSLLDKNVNGIFQ